MTSLLFVSGSLRTGSVNSAAIRAARRIAAADPRVSHTTLLSLRSLPFYDADVEELGTPRAVEAARAAVRAADAVVISTPSYNGAPPGVLKNALDWLSRPAGDSVLDGAIVATMSASPGRLGGLDSQQALRAVLTRCGCRLVEFEPLVAISDARRRCEPTGEFTEPLLLRQISRLLDATVATVAATSPLAPELSGALR